MKRNRLKYLLLAGVGLAAFGAATGAAQAQISSSPIKIDGGPLGQLNLSGGYDAYAYAFSGSGVNSLLGNSKSTGVENRVLDLKITKPTGLVRFTIEVKPDDSLYFGVHPSAMTANTFTTGPVYLAYVTLAPTPDFSVSVGQVGSVEGWESSTDWNNRNIIDSPLYYVENSSSRGVSISYTKGPFSDTLVYGDGFDSGVFNVVQNLATYAFDSNNALSLYTTINFGRTGPNTYAYGNGTTGYGYPSYNAAYVNSNMIGAYYDYTNGNLSLTPEVQYVYSKVDHKIGIDKFTSNLGAELIGGYKFGKSPWSVGGQIMYYRNNGPQAWYLNAHSAGIMAGVTPTWQKGHIFVRGEAGLLHLTQVGDGPGFGGNGTDRNQVISLLEAGFVF